VQELTFQIDFLTVVYVPT